MSNQTPDFVELGNEYANLVLASEFGMDRFGDSAKGNTSRELEIEAIFKAHNIDNLQDYVENALEDLKAVR